MTARPASRGMKNGQLARSTASAENVGNPCRHEEADANRRRDHAVSGFKLIITPNCTGPIP